MRPRICPTLFVIVAAACSDDRATFEAGGEDTIAIYDAAIDAALGEIGPGHGRLVFLDRLYEADAALPTEQTDRAIIPELVRRYADARLCVSDDCPVEAGEMLIVVSPLSRAARGMASVQIIAYRDGESETGTLYDVRLERRDGVWHARGVSSSDMDVV